MFLKKAGDIIKGEEVTLVVEALLPADENKGYVPAYILGVLKNSTGDRVGRISLRIGSNELINRYAGHVGYTVDKVHRGHGFAEKGCRLLAGLAKDHGFTSLYITCNPDNLPSRRTIENLGAALLGVESVPKDTEMYTRGDRMKLRYVWKV